MYFLIFCRSVFDVRDCDEGDFRLRRDCGVICGRDERGKVFRVPKSVNTDGMKIGIPWE